MLQHELNEFEELAIPLPNGGTLCCAAGEDYEFGGSIHIRDADGNEVVMWTANELEEDPEAVLGAVFSSALSPIQLLLKQLKRSLVVEGCWI